ncbi:MAG: exo-alpha-sialidase [Lentisphaeria bacterium]|nr:exo-alpha-sialidase [Lentisphaeria bacterium]
MNKNTNPDLTEQFIRAQLDKTMIPAEVKKNPPLYYWPEVNDYTMSCGIAETPGGRIWLGWFAGGDDERAVLMLAKSDDGGNSFSTPQYYIDPGFVDCGMHISAVVANLWTAPDGRLFVFFTVSLGYYDGRAGSWFTVCENPDADDPQWSIPQRIANGASLNKPTVLSDGTWLLCVSLWRREHIRQGAASDRLFPELDGERMANVYASKDQGKTWERIGGVKNQYPTFDEHMIVERADGSLLMYLRDICGMTQSESFDKGHTWTKPVPTPFPAASARFFLRKLKSGNILLVRNNDPIDPKSRSTMTAFLSDDNGKTWKGGLVLDERYGVSYPDGYQTEDGRIFIQYDWMREKGEIMLAIFREEDILAEKAVSPDTKLKHPIMQTWTAAHSK